MADNETTTKVEEQKPPPGETEEILSLESLDSLIASEDPEFAQSLNELGSIENVDLDITDEGPELEYSLSAEERKWQDSTGLRQKLFKALPFLPKVSYQFKMKRTYFRLMLRRWKEQAIFGIKNFGPMTLAWVKRKVGSLKEGLSEGVSAFREFTLVKKVLFVLLVGVTGASGYFLYRLATKGLLPHEENLFINTMAEWAGTTYQYDPAATKESFYESTRTAQNILLMKKMVVNLRRSPESGLNPMGAFEFLVEGAAMEVVLEIKDREPEIEDLFLRTIEDMTYDQIASGEGKRLLCERLRKEVNRVLTKGFVRRIFIKTVIVKP